MKSLIFLMFLPLSLMASPQAESIINQSGGVAVKGVDVVAYFEVGQTVYGQEEFSVQYEGATWLFSSNSNKEKFLGAPETYLPAYGGYCAWAVSQGYTADIDPNQWIIHEGQLYLNFNASVQQRFTSDIDNLIDQGNSNWFGIKEGIVQSN